MKKTLVFAMLALLVLATTVSAAFNPAYLNMPRAKTISGFMYVNDMPSGKAITVTTNTGYSTVVTSDSTTGFYAVRIPQEYLKTPLVVTFQVDYYKRTLTTTGDFTHVLGFMLRARQVGSCPLNAPATLSRYCYNN